MRLESRNEKEKDQNRNDKIIVLKSFIFLYPAKYEPVYFIAAPVKCSSHPPANSFVKMAWDSKAVFFSVI